MMKKKLLQRKVSLIMIFSAVYQFQIIILNGRIIFQINNKLISDSKVNGSHSYMQSNGVIKNIIMIKIFHLYARICSFFFFTMIESEFLFHTHSLSIYHNFVVHSVFVFLRFSFVSNLIV